jgi:hypothetical protein
VRPLLVARVSARGHGTAQFSTAAIFYARFIDSRGKLIAARSALQLILLLIRESGVAGLHGSAAFSGYEGMHVLTTLINCAWKTFRSC